MGMTFYVRPILLSYPIESVDDLETRYFCIQLFRKPLLYLSKLRGRNTRIGSSSRYFPGQILINLHASSLICTDFPSETWEKHGEDEPQTHHQKAASKDSLLQSSSYARRINDHNKYTQKLDQGVDSVRGSNGILQTFYQRSLKHTNAKSD